MKTLPKKRPSHGLSLFFVLCACSEEATVDAPAQGEPLEAASYVTVEDGAALTVVEAPARLVATATASADLTFLALGVIRRIFVRPGDEVKAGQPVVEIASPALAEAASEWRSASDTLSIAEDRLDRMEALARERLTSQDDLQTRRQEIALLRGRRRQLQAILRAHGVTRSRFDAVHEQGSVTLRSPISGIITEIEVRLGQSVGPDHGALARVVGAGRPRVEAMLQDRARPDLEYVFISVDGDTFEVDGGPVGAVSSPKTGTWTTWFDLAKSIELVGVRVGELEGRVHGDDVFSIPSSAIGNDDDGPFVARRSAGPSPERLRIEVHRDDGRMAVVRADLSIGDELARDPGLALDER